MDIPKTAKILMASGITLLAGAFFFRKKAKAGQVNFKNVNHSRPVGNEKIITSHDAVYNYKYSNGNWYTQKKGAKQWINMKTALSPENYKLAISRLQKYISYD